MNGTSIITDFTYPPYNIMISNDVHAEVRDVVETIVAKVIDRVSNIDDEISPLALTPRNSLHRMPTK